MQNSSARIKEAQRLLRNAKRPLALAGAGLSAESGVPTFRGEGGLWRNYRPEDLATPAAFRRDPQTVWEWYAYRRDTVATCKPNAAHEALVALEKQNENFWLVTQNVDRLSQRAGATRVLELHGSIWDVRCNQCAYEKEDLTVPTPLSNACPQCKAGLLRPGVVWFGEALNPVVLQKVGDLVAACDLLFVLGTSAQVYPAAGFVPLAAKHGATIIEINPDDTPMSNLAAVTLRLKVGEVLGEVVLDPHRSTT
jgi:NAD-dependent deacetylase